MVHLRSTAAAVSPADSRERRVLKQKRAGPDCHRRTTPPTRQRSHCAGSSPPPPRPHLLEGAQHQSALDRAERAHTQRGQRPGSKSCAPLGGDTVGGELKALKPEGSLSWKQHKGCVREPDTGHRTASARACVCAWIGTLWRSRLVKLWHELDSRSPAGPTRAVSEQRIPDSARSAARARGDDMWRWAWLAQLRSATHVLCQAHAHVRACT